MTDSNTNQTDKRITLEQAYKKSSLHVSNLLKQKHGILGQAVNHLAQAPGKEVRARLLLQSAVGRDNLVPEAACNAAAAVELFHLATLVHDDVIDDAKTRRGISSVQSIFGKKQAVIVGDYLLCLSFTALAELERDQMSTASVDIISSFIAVASRICTGEYNQLIHNYNLEISFKDYYKTISGKTGALFWIAAYMGAVLGGEPEQQSKKVARFGQMVGLIFQILDDCKDYEMTENEALKPVKSDLKEGVITLPLIIAMTKDKSLKKDVKRVFQGSLDPVEMIDKVKQNDGIEASLNLSKRYFSKASKLLNGLENESKKVVLQQSLEQIFPVLSH
jgi:geranylgeranyl pyrophosphate synthase